MNLWKKILIIFLIRIWNFIVMFAICTGEVHDRKSLRHFIKNKYSSFSSENYLNGVLIELSPDDAENLSVFDDVYELKIEPTVCEDGSLKKF